MALNKSMFSNGKLLLSCRETDFLLVDDVAPVVGIMIIVIHLRTADAGAVW